MDQLDFNELIKEFIKKTANNDQDIVTLTIMLQNLGCSKKKIKSEIRKYKRSKKKKMSLFPE